MGMILAALVVLLAQEPEKPARSPVLEGLAWLLAHQRADGSWGAEPVPCTCRPADRDGRGGDLESSAWALLALAGGGYTELSSDELNGHAVGAAVRTGLEWLMAKQDKDGAFDRGNPATNAAAALALTETYGMTTKRKEAAEKAYAWAEKTRPQDATGLVRLGMVVMSGKLSELGAGHREKLLELATALDALEGDLARYGSLLLKGYAKEKPPMKLAPPDALPPETLNLLAVASFILGDQDEWHKWFFALRDVMAPRQRRGEKLCESGSWDATTYRERVRGTALRCLVLQHYRCYYCRNPFRKK